MLEAPDGARRLLASADFERANDAWFAEELGASIGWPVDASELSFEGGNLVADREHVFIGENTILDNAGRLEATAAEVVRRFELELGAPVLVVGPSPSQSGTST